MRRAPAAIGLLLLALPACAEEDAAAWTPVKRGDLVLGAEVTGALAAVDSTPVKPPPIADKWDFKISHMADEGVEIAEGEPVVAFDASEMVQQLEQLQNDTEAVRVALQKRRTDAAMARKDEALRLAEAEATVRKASLKANQPDDLAPSLEARTAQLDHQLAGIDLAHARSAAERTRASDASAIRSLEEKLAYYEGRVRDVQASIGRMQVASPRAGTVIYPEGWRGEKKKVGDAAWRMETVVEVVSLDRMIGKGQVDEVDAAVVREGQRVTLRLDAHPDTELVGRVAELANTVQRKSHADPSKVVRLEIELEPAEGVPLRPGMRFRGQVETEVAEGVLTIPSEAVFITERGPVAYRRTDDGHEAVRLEIGRRNARQIEVLSGLAEGDQVSRVDLAREAP